MIKERNLSLDFIKILAMIFVIGLHTGTTWIVFDIDINAYYRWSIFGTAIPLFFSVSGYLLLGRKNVDWKYSFKKIWGITRFVFIVCWIYWAGRFLITGEPYWDKLYKDPLGAFLMGGTFWQFWYFGSMNIIYILYPILNKLYNEKYNIFALLFVCLIITCAAIHIINIITPGTLEAKLPQSLRIWNWLMYFCLGGIIKKNNNTIGWKWVCLLAIAYCIQLNIVSKINPTMMESSFNFSSPLTLLYIYCLFQALCHLDVLKFSIGINLLSPLFLPVYTIHPFLIYPTQAFRHSFHAGYPIYWMIITIASIAVSWVIMQTKIGKWVFRI